MKIFINQMRYLFHRERKRIYTKEGWKFLFELDDNHVENAINYHETMISIYRRRGLGKSYTSKIIIALRKEKELRKKLKLWNGRQLAYEDFSDIDDESRWGWRE